LTNHHFVLIKHCITFFYVITLRRHLSFDLARARPSNPEASSEPAVAGKYVKKSCLAEAWYDRRMQIPNVTELFHHYALKSCLHVVNNRFIHIYVAIS